MSDVRKRLPSLSSNRRELVERLLQEQGVGILRPPAIRRRSGREATVLSFAQERLWFLDQFEPGSAFYNILGSYRIWVSLNVEAVERSINEIIRRHESLRTRFSVIDGQPVQVIAEEMRVKISVTDLRQLPEEERELQAQHIAGVEAQQPFDLKTGPLIRATLLRMGDADYVVMVTVHHIVSDGWSMEIFNRELSKLYEAYCIGRPSPLKELPIQYADYAIWQREWLKGEVLEEQLRYWREQLAGAPPVMELPADRVRPAIQRYRGTYQPLVISGEATEVMKEIGQEEGATLYMVMLTVFKVLLYKYTNQGDIVVGTPIAGRTRSETEGLIGFFVNTLVMRTKVEGGMSFRELVRRVKEVTLGAYGHQELPFEKLVEHVQPERDMSRNPVFQVMFVLQNVPREAKQGSGERGGGEAPQIITGTAKFDLTLGLVENEKGLMGTIEYNTDLYEDNRITRMIGHLQNIVEEVRREPEKRIEEIEMMGGEELRQVIEEWNRTEEENKEGGRIERLFEEQVEREPEGIAVMYEEEEISYGELNAKANQMGWYLRKEGVGAEELVGICMKRSEEMVIAVLGVLKAGGAYVPLDPEYPKQRVRQMVEEARIRVIILGDEIDEELVEGVERVIRIGSERGAIAEQSRENLATALDGDNLAYVIYTSGSTGVPKGAMNTHAAVCNRLLWMQQTYHLVKTDRVLQKTPFSFDVSVWELLWPLMNGATMVIAGPGQHRDSGALVNLIARRQITTVHFVPSMLQAFLAEPNVRKCVHLTRVICSGEAMQMDLQKRFFQRLSADLHNLYGPTEAAIDVTYWKCERETDRLAVPIGRPIANTQIYILDESLRPVAVGVPGQIYIGGVGVARGYLNRADMTSERFLPDPYSGRAGARMYKTGDLGRFGIRGEIEFLGRTDHQVKLRGYRIELGEIEAALSGHTKVQGVIVVMRADAGSVKRLVAYVVSDLEASDLATELHQYVRERLPEHMAPSNYVKLDKLPLTPNGKIDRQGLPALGMIRPGMDKIFVAPNTPIEQKMADIWREVLPVKQIGIHDNFFELGGHSLIATQILARIRDRFMVDVPLRRLFEIPTIAGLCEAVEETRASGKAMLAPAITPTSREAHRTKLSTLN